MRELELFDTTYRDGAQGMGDTITNLSDVLRALTAMDQLGCIKYFEMGFAASSGTDHDRIVEAMALPLNGTVAAFGRTHASDVDSILKLAPKTAVLVGKSRRRDVRNVINLRTDDYLVHITDCVSALVREGIEVIFDAEHFFDAMLLDDEKYAMSVLSAANEGGASRLVLCDTNGGITTVNMERVLRALIDEDSLYVEHPFISLLGVHFHDDRGRAVSLSEDAFECGIRHIQGTFGGFGERCGNTDLSVLIPNLVLDHDYRGISEEAMVSLMETYQLVCASLNRPPNSKHPYVGSYAFGTEAGMHQSGLSRDTMNYLHVDPGRFGNRTRIGLTTQSGWANLAARAEDIGIRITPDVREELVEEFDRLVTSGYDFSAEATFELWLRRKLGLYEYPFTLQTLELTVGIRNLPVIGVKDIGEVNLETLADLRLNVGDEQLLHVADGDGPVDAIVGVLRRSLHDQFPSLLDVRLTGYRVMTYDVQRGSAATVQVYFQWSDGHVSWHTMSAHENLVYASLLAVYDGYVYKLLKNGDNTH